MDSSIPSISKIEKLDNNNFLVWSVRIKTLLSCYGHLEIVTGESPIPTPDADNANAAAIKKWKKDDAVARSLILNSVDNEQALHLDNLTTSKAMFDKLEQLHADSSTLNKHLTMKKYLNYQIKSSIPVLAVLGFLLWFPVFWLFIFAFLSCGCGSRHFYSSCFYFKKQRALFNLKH